MKIDYHCNPDDYDRLLAAGFHPVVRWVELGDPTGASLKAIEALTLLDRREEALTKTQPKPKGKR